MVPVPPPPAAAAASVSTRTAAAGVNALGISLISRLCDRAKGTNAFVSPASIASALALALAGAPPQSETARYVERVMW